MPELNVEDNIAIIPDGYIHLVIIPMKLMELKPFVLNKSMHYTCLY
jgi:hypothetical protein